MPLERQNPGRVLIVAGSDPSGGAGIQADIKTVTALGGYAATAITALTVQNTLGVTDVMPIPASFVAAQMQAVLSDIGADCIKTGMLYSASVIEAVIAVLQDDAFAGPLVVDPVVVATSGAVLLQPEAVGCLKKHLFPMATILTPNIPEAALLTGITIETKDDMRRAGDMLLEMGVGAVLMKGGHMDGDTIEDMLLTADGGEYSCMAPKRHTRHTHGTGCTLASALATKLARGETLEDAFRAAHAYVQAAMKATPGLGGGNGPLGHAAVRMS